MMKKVFYFLLGVGVALMLGNYLVVPYLQHRQLVREMESPPATIEPELTCIQRLEQRATTARFRAEWGTPMRQVGHNTYIMGNSTTDSLTLEFQIQERWSPDLPPRKTTIADTIFGVAGLSPAAREALVARAKHDLYCRWLERGKADCIRQQQRDSLNAVVRQYGGRYQPAPDECAERPEVCR